MTFPCSAFAATEIVEPDGEYFAAFSRSCPHEFLDQAEVDVDKRQVFGEFGLDLMCVNPSGSLLDRGIDDVPWIGPFEVWADAACGNARRVEEVLNEAVEFRDFVGYGLDQRVSPIISAGSAGIESSTLAEPRMAARGEHSSCESVP